VKTGRWATDDDVRERRERVAALFPLLNGNLCAIARQLADEYGVPFSEKLVRVDREALDLEAHLPGRGLTARELDEQREQATRRYLAGATGEEVGAELGISGTAAIRLIPKELRRPAGGRCDEPKPQPRKCEIDDCKVSITPTRAQLRKGEGRFCLKHGRQGSDEKRKQTRERDLERHARARAKLDELKRERDLLETNELVERWFVSDQMISKHYRELGLDSELVTLEGARFRVYPRAAVERFEFHWVRKGQDPRRLANRLKCLDPDFYVMVLERQGKLERIAARMNVSIDVAKVVLRAKAQRRRELLIDHHSGRGRTGIPEDRRERLNRWTRELLDDYERRKEDDLLDEPGERPPSKSKIARQAIHEELQEHPERWSEEYVRALDDDGAIVRTIRPEMEARAAKTFLKSVRDAQQRDKTPANRGHETLAA